jgi:hypothetical protein
MAYPKGSPRPIGSGRKKGTPNKRTLMVNELMDKVGVDPLEIMLRIAAGDWKGLGYDNETYVLENAQGGTKIGYTITPEMRLSAAKEAAQYLYCKKKEEPIDDSIDVTHEDKKEFLAAAEKELEKLRLEIRKEDDEVPST